MKTFLEISYTNGLAILDLIMWGIGLTVIYLLLVHDLIKKVYLKFRKTKFAKYYNYYYFKYKFRKLSEDDYKTNLIRFWKANFILDRHLKKVLNDNKEFNKLLKEKIKNRQNMIKLKEKINNSKNFK